MGLSPEQYSRLQRGTTRFIFLVKIEATEENGGDTLLLALNTKPITFESEVYKSMPLEPSEMEALSGMAVDNMTVSTILQNSFSRMNIKGGKWQGAKVSIYNTCFDEPEIGIIRGQIGRFGQITVAGREATIEFRGLTQLLDQEIGDLTSRLCRYVLGDEDCGVDMTPHTFTGSVTAVNNRQKFTISTSQATGKFDGGLIKFTSGQNNGLSMEVDNNIGQVITLFQPMLGTIVNGDSYIIKKGCKKDLSTCDNEFGNGANHGGEDCIPSRETLYKIPETPTN